MLEARAGAALARALTALDETLQARRQEIAGEIEKSLSLLQIQDQLRALGKDLEANFRASFASSFRARAGQATAPRVYGDGSAKTELSLVDDEQVAEELALQVLANRLQGACEAEMHDLEPRVGFMLGRDQLDAPANPLGTTALCEALHDMCVTLDVARDDKQLLLDMLVTEFARELGPIYKEINELLVARRILPLGRPWVKRARQDRRGAKRPESAERRKDVSGIIEQLFMPYADAAADTSQGRSDWHASGTGQEVMGMLTSLQKGATSAALGNRTFTLNPTASGTTNILNSLLQAGLGKHLGAVEGTVIDVVATLFDYIFEDERVPVTMKELIGRLQIPVLKLAMMDHSFFSDRSQPARRLINTLAQAAITWEGELTTDSWLYDSARNIVLRIQKEFADRPEVFAACLKALEDDLADQERRADERAAALTGRLEQREREEIARTVGQNAIAAHRDNAELPASVRDFLAETWLKVLARAALDGGETGAAWGEACATMEELVWSVRPKTDAGERQRLVQRLPPLLKGLRSGMEAARIEQAAREAFFTELVRLHAAAVKAGMAPAAGTRARVAVPDDGPLLQAPLLPSGPKRAAPAGDEPRETFEVEMLRRGDWIQLTDETGEVRRVRLTWISPARTMYLFANRQGQRALALTRGELVRRFTQRQAMTAGDDALMDRIVDDVLDSYQNPEERPR